jgi:hypothetical protein
VVPGILAHLQSARVILLDVGEAARRSRERSLIAGARNNWMIPAAFPSGSRRACRFENASHISVDHRHPAGMDLDGLRQESER